MKKMTLGLALAAASAGAFADWAPIYLDGSYTSTVTYGPPGGAVQTVNAVEKMDASGHAAGPVGAFAQKALTLQPLLKADLDTASAAGVPAGTSFVSGAMTGGLQIYMTAPTFGTSGVNHVSLSGPTYTATYSSSGSSYGIHYTCTLRATMANLQVAGSYNTLSSQIDASQTTLNFTPQSNASCSTSLDWLPIFGDWAARMATGAANQATLANLSAFQGTTLQSVLPGAPQYVGFNAAIPAGIFMFAGQDMGQYIKNNSAALLSTPGATVLINIGAPQIEGPFVYGTSETAPLSYYNTEFSISFGSFAGTLGYKVSSARYFDYTYQCPAGSTRGCNEP